MKYFFLPFFMVTSLWAQVEVVQHGDLTITTEEIAVTPAARKKAASVLGIKDFNPGFGEILMQLNDLVVLGESVYNLVEKGKPSINSEWASINVVPLNPEDKSPIHPYDLENVSAPITRSFRKSMTHLRVKVVEFEYMVIYQIGQYEGKGKYLQNVVIIPTKVTGRWSAEFSSKMKVVSIANIGRKDNPISNAIVSMTYTMSALFKNQEITDVLNISGNGTATVVQ